MTQLAPTLSDMKRYPVAYQCWLDSVRERYDNVPSPARCIISQDTAELFRLCEQGDITSEYFLDRIGQRESKLLVFPFLAVVDLVNSFYQPA